MFDLQKEGGGVDDVDDANGHEVFEEYEWAGQTRIRATTLLEGGFRGNNHSSLHCKDLDFVGRGKFVKSLRLQFIG